MTATFRAETRKLLTTRTALGLGLGAVVIAVMATTGISGQTAADLARPLKEQVFLFFGGMNRVLLILIGVRMVTDEYHHGTAVPTFVATPARHRVLLAKLGVGAGFGALAGAVAQGVMLVAAGVMFEQKGATLVVDGHVPGLLLGGAAAGALWAAIGVGVGTIVRHQVGAIVGSVVWVLLLEQLLESRLGDLAPYLPVTASYPITVVPTATLALEGAAILAGWVVVLAFAGAVVQHRRDLA